MAFNFSASLDLSTSMRLSQELSVLPGGRGRRTLYMFGSFVTSIALLGDGLFHVTLADHKRKREGQSLSGASSKECCEALVPVGRVTASSSQVLWFVLKYQQVVNAAYCRLLFFIWGQCLLYQLICKSHWRFLLTLFVFCRLWFVFDPLLLLFWVASWLYFCNMDRPRWEKSHKSWILPSVNVCNVRSTLCLLWLKSGCSNHWKEPSRKTHWIFDCQSAISQTLYPLKSWCRKSASRAKPTILYIGGTDS